MMAAARHGLKLRQNYNREAPHLARCADGPRSVGAGPAARIRGGGFVTARRAARVR
ncbi:MAG: Mobile element protein [uncultured Paraburkholderia sp.]|nr:MAG: Mobile element protein [uncultured Paraburkholderia sp.]